MINFNFLQTFLLLIPYISLFLFFKYAFNNDAFFIRKKSYFKIDFLISICFLTSFLFILWNSYFYTYIFLGLKISKETIFFNDKFITFLGVVLAVIGWLYTVRSQLNSNMKNHSIQTIMNARLSECYNEKFDSIYEILANDETLTLDKYNSLSPKEKSVVHYILNYYESVAISIRYSEFEEEIVKSMMRSQVIRTYKTFKEVLDYLKNESSSYYEHFHLLHNRWNELS